MDFNNYNDFSKPNRFSGIDRNSKRVLPQTTEEKKKTDEKIDEKVTDTVENSVKNESKDEDESKKEKLQEERCEETPDDKKEIKKPDVKSKKNIDKKMNVKKVSEAKDIKDQLSYIGRIPKSILLKIKSDGFLSNFNQSDAVMLFLAANLKMDSSELPSDYAEVYNKYLNYRKREYQDDAMSNDVRLINEKLIDLNNISRELELMLNFMILSETGFVRTTVDNVENFHFDIDHFEELLSTIRKTSSLFINDENRSKGRIKKAPSRNNNIKKR